VTSKPLNHKNFAPNINHVDHHPSDDVYGLTNFFRLHSNVVKGFLRNAYEMLRESGQVHITLKTAHPFNKWKIEDLAEDVGLDLAEKVKFGIYQYPGYRNKRGYGSRSDRTFPVGECSTFKFCKYVN